MTYQLLDKQFSLVDVEGCYFESKAKERPKYIDIVGRL